MEPCELMKYFPRFTDFLQTQITYEQLINNLHVNSIVSQNLSKFKLNLPVIERKEITTIIVPDGWQDEFKECLPEIQKALMYVNSQIKLGKNVWPKEENLFRAFQLTALNNVKVIVIGQDPYHSPEVANGLAFSCNGDKIQSSLVNVFKELRNIYGREPSSGNLDHWAQQGVLLLNKCLTVNEGEAKSHGDSWKFFIHKILNIILLKVRFCFLCLWGKEAQKLVEGRDKLTFSSQKVLVLKAGHPSGLNTKDPFVGCGHFKIINDLLIANGEIPIDWIGN